MKSNTKLITILCVGGALLASAGLFKLINAKADEKPSIDIEERKEYKKLDLTNLEQKLKDSGLTSTTSPSDIIDKMAEVYGVDLIDGIFEALPSDDNSIGISSKGLVLKGLGVSLSLKPHEHVILSLDKTSTNDDKTIIYFESTWGTPNTTGLRSDYLEHRSILTCDTSQTEDFSVLTQKGYISQSMLIKTTTNSTDVYPVISGIEVWNPLVSAAPPAA